MTRRLLRAGKNHAKPDATSSLRPISCLVCGGSNFRPSRISGLLSCEECGFTTADLTISEEELRQLYTARYFTGEEYRDYVADQPVILKQFRLRLRRLLKFVPNAQKKNLFEIGCAHGFFLALAKDRFLSVEGIDISDDAVAYARSILKVEATSSNFLTHEFAAEPHVVCMWDTIEHLCRPDLYLKKIADALPRNGLLALTTSDLDSWMARARGGKWRQIHPPTHLHYFSRKTLGRLLRRNGFEIEYIGTERMYRGVDTMIYIVLCLKHNFRELYGLFRKARLLNWDLYLNLGDIVFVVARKV
jgi:2-polyprenyl-3-methyl-5-hydroxy-6-metoxy-1,4-benzoquinol methylase